MYDKPLAFEILRQIEWSAKTIQKRFQPVKSVADFTLSDAGMEKLDAICMQLIAIGESLKNLDKVTSHTLLSQHSNVDWQKVKGMRDVISHHYFDVDAEIVYAVCTNEIGDLLQAVQNMMAELKK